MTTMQPAKPLMSAKQSQALRRKARTTAALEHEKSLAAQKKSRDLVAAKTTKAAAKRALASQESTDRGGDDAPNDRLDAQPLVKKSGSKRKG